MDSERALDIPLGVAAVDHSVLRVQGDDAVDVTDHLAVEEPLEIRLGGMSLAVTMRTPGDDAELVAGLLYSEGVIAGPDNLDVIAHYRGPDGDAGPGNVVNVLLKGDVRAARERLRRTFVASSACGLCGKVTIESIQTHCPPVASDAVVAAELFHHLATRMNTAQSTFERTGGLHAAALFDTDGQLVVLREDIGRHNAVDKVIGHMLRAGRLPLDGAILMVSGRASFEIMQKAWMARIPIVAAVSAPSSMAVQMAVAADITLVGFLRRGGFNVYSARQRVITGIPELV